MKKRKLHAIFTRKPKLYQDDRTIQIMIQLEQGTLGIMNLTPRYYQGKIFENDLNGELFRTITQAKDYCKEHLEQFTGVVLS